MEDEEYEDVLVISYTDHGSSILPQSTAEKIMNGTSLEILQQVTGTGREKFGDSFSEEGSVIDRLIPTQTYDAFNWSCLPRSNYLISFLRWKTGVQGRCIYLNNSELKVYNKDFQLLNKFTQKSYYPLIVVLWHNSFLIAQWRDSILVWEEGKTGAIQTSNHILPELHARIITTKQYAYFKSTKNEIIRLNRGFKESVFYKGPVEDFELETKRKFLKTECKDPNFTFLAKSGLLTSTRGPHLQLPRSNEKTLFCAIRALRKQHIVVVERLADLQLGLSEQKLGLHLVHDKTLAHLHFLDLAQAGEFNPISFNLLAPRG